MKIFNSLTKRKEEFKPIEEGKVKLYVCGMTVYDRMHIGHARSWIIFDMIVRYLRMRSYEVNFIRNITDIDDKIIDRAKEQNENPTALAERFIRILHEDENALHVLSADKEPRATQYIPQIIQLIERLMKNESAYIGQNGDVYFNVRCFKDYGKLSHRNLDQLRANTYTEIGKYKHDPLDFVLWKQTKPGEPKWNSPWGEGRPGWHIECSTMSNNLLGQPFDIHGGGLDLKFPHHENEIAQSEAAEKKPFVMLWMHTGLLEIEKEKMSKSLGNIIPVQEVLKEHDVEVLRYFLLSGHYRSPLNYSKVNLNNGRAALERLYLSLRGLPCIGEKLKPSSLYTDRFKEAMDNDFNTPMAFVVLFEITREINRLRNENQIEKAAILGSELKHLGHVFGLLNQVPERFLQGNGGKKEMDILEIETFITQRNDARVKKDWKTADQIRNQLSDFSVTIEDSSEGTYWRRK
ncbi:cysteine--tRNA ligase [Coxiella endosymbiont of Amblyomma nuttalli]|uniref:cysteine--tRNA ligase n=1 Tax=Coxiella endosymbiont of Amblyomma nuttalli TaxID=2749996 RepID=UPI001BAD1850|nr:cysteine--tRNA ligase [Coxiella endosymbiont of Amblyomma nuttalli]QTS83654.1 Cysteine--tRNA ligase [Coxiella endosymbiont of Amblyomma nuttalli]